ncbi:hypothetical protein MMPV_001100 [Pyropia vietnamensis]
MKGLVFTLVVAAAATATVIATTITPAVAIPSTVEGDAASAALLKARLHAVYCAAGGDRFGCAPDGTPAGDMPSDDYLAARSVLCGAHPELQGCEVPPVEADVAASSGYVEGGEEVKGAEGSCEEGVCPAPTPATAV